MTTQATQAAVEAIAGVVRNVSGILQAPNYPPNTASYQPIAITYVFDGVLDNGPIGTRKDLWTIVVEVLIPKRKLDDDIKTLTPFLDTVPAALQGEVSDAGGRFGGTIQTFESTSITYLPLVDYAGTEMHGYRFAMNRVKILVAT